MEVEDFQPGMLEALKVFICSVGRPFGIGRRMADLHYLYLIANLQGLLQGEFEELEVVPSDYQPYYLHAVTP